jgi:hypothetical protein
MSVNNLGVFEYNGDGQTLDRGRYIVFETEDGIEAYPEGEGEPVNLPNRGVFESLRSGNLDSVPNGTPMR